ncbi:uncharacterized protein [Rutidosis leptorrhynchoides]|uniref:uncharacterized protein n=1 Tax=Rutidosis leptorrhynchoides TaxID=125765 RepID=UPI003A992646
MTIAMREFQECLDTIQVMDLNYSGINFTWNQSPLGSHEMLKKIDRVLANETFITEFPNAYTIFQPYRISDQSPTVVKIHSFVKVRPKMFHFSNYIVDNDEFMGCVADVWRDLDNLQKQLDENPSSSQIRDAEILKLKEYNDALWDEERFIKQKSKVEWLQVGDNNSKYFHKVVKAKVNRCRINAVTNSDDILVEGAAVSGRICATLLEFFG